MSTQLWTAIPVPGARVRAVPGGWLVTELEHREVWSPGERARVEIVALGSSFVADPTAPHCQPPPTPVGPPPMTDAELVAWCTALWGKPLDDPDGGLRWEGLSDHGASCRAFSCGDNPWLWSNGVYCLPARVFGPALWAAQHFGGTP
jgi:hypothetical protein